MSMFIKENLIKQIKLEFNKKIQNLPYEIEFNLNEKDLGIFFKQSKNIVDFRNLCFQSVISQFVMLETPFCDYDISEQISIIKEFYDFIK